MNTKAQIVVKTPFGQCEPFIYSNVVRQGTVFGPVLHNCSIDKFSKESYPYFYGKTEIKSLEFVDDIADINDQHPAALLSNKIIQNVQDRKRLTFSAEKCEMLKINPTKTGFQASISINVRQLSQLVVLVTLVILLMLRVTTKNCVQSNVPERKAQSLS